MTRLPRLAVRLIEWRFTPDESEAIVGDLSEEFSERVSRDGAPSARRWFWRHALASLFARRGRAATETRVVFSGISQDVRFALRSLRRAPGFTATAVATLALGIGAAAAVGTAASRTLLRPLPYPTGSRLVGIGFSNADGIGNVGFETIVDWRPRVKSFDEIAAIRDWQPTLTDPAGAVRLIGKRVSWNYFRMLGIQPAIGRDFGQAEDTPAGSGVVILSQGLWRQRFGGSPSAVGSTMELNGRSYLVAGVLPSSFEPTMGGAIDVWAPLGYVVGGDSSCRSCRHLKALARLAPGATIAQARREIAAVHADLHREFPADYNATPPQLASLHDLSVRDLARPLTMLAGAVLFVLLVACANVAGLMIARSSDRIQEMSLRAALGANRGRLIRQLIVESGLLAMASVAAGVALARLALTALAARAPIALPALDDAADPWLLGVAAVIGVIVMIVCGVAPAILASRVNLESTLRNARQTASRDALRAREWLMATEIAAALLVVAGGGLMYRTVDRLLGVDPGFRSEGVLTAGLSLVGPRWAEDSSVRTFQSDLLARLKHVPGIQSVALAGQVPLGGNYDTRGFVVIGHPPANPADKPDAERYSVTPDYFDLMRIPLKRGRLIADADRFEADKVIDINETMAREVFPGESPIGKQLQFGSAARPRVMTVVGVVGDVRHYSLAEPARSQFYTTQEQFTDSFLVLVVRAQNSDGLGDAIRRTVAGLAADVPVYDIAPFDRLVATSIAMRSFLMLLLTALSGITLVLAGVGLYGVVSQTVAARRREFGIRVALGASRSSVLSLVARRGGMVCLGGIALGLGATAASGRLIKALLFETAPFDPLTIAAAVLLLLAVALLAHALPMRRALRADPRETLRAD